MAPSPIDLLNYDVLALICRFIATPEWNAATRSYTTSKSLKAFAATKKHFRDLARPYMFQTVTVRGYWDKALQLINEIEKCPAAVPYIR